MNPYHDNDCKGLAVQTQIGTLGMQWCTPECLLRTWALTERKRNE